MESNNPALSFAIPPTRSAKQKHLTQLIRHIDYFRSKTDLCNLSSKKPLESSGDKLHDAYLVHNHSAVKLAQLLYQTNKLKKKLIKNRNELDEKNGLIDTLKNEREIAYARLQGKDCYMEFLKDCLFRLYRLVFPSQTQDCTADNNSQDSVKSTDFLDHHFTELQNMIINSLSKSSLQKTKLHSLKKKTAAVTQEKEDLKTLNDSLESQVQSAQKELSIVQQAAERQSELIRSLQGELRGKTYELYICKQRLSKSDPQDTVAVPESLADLKYQNQQLTKQLAEATTQTTQAKQEYAILHKENEELKLRIEKLQRSQDNLTRQIRIPRTRNSVKELRAMKSRLEQLSPNSSPAHSPVGSPRSPAPAPPSADTLFNIKLQVEKTYKTFLVSLEKTKDADVSQYITDRTGYCTVESQLNSIVMSLQEHIDRLLDFAHSQQLQQPEVRCQKVRKPCGLSFSRFSVGSHF